jgi:UDP-N-acetylmuramate: L-alanyl-gamma-D-glutamyl-meso-diaminopimelate ligase
VKIFVAGICGTFMAGIAQIASALGHEVSGCDANVYPPMSDVLARAGITPKQGYLAEHIDHDVDCTIIGNVLSRGNPVVEHILDHKLNYDSGPGWIRQNVLRDYQVIAVAGTHGKTSTASMIAWILQHQGLSPGFLIGGKPGNFSASARIGNGPQFVIEADEYDTAFFDKRSKFVHYCPNIAILNNLEFDHADIFDDIRQIKRQFHHLVRIVPSTGHVIFNQDDENIDAVLKMGVWSKMISFSTAQDQANWSAQPIKPDASIFSVLHKNRKVAEVNWHCIGRHNMANGIAAIAASSLVGIEAPRACEALSEFIPGARRLQRLFHSTAVTLYEDFAHHPTAIAHTLAAVSAAHSGARLIAIVEPRSNTMEAGCHNETLGPALSAADHSIFYLPGTLGWDPRKLVGGGAIEVCENPDQLIHLLRPLLTKPAVVVAMSNGSFDGVPGKIQLMLQQSEKLL